MNSLERVKSALTLEQPDRVPIVEWAIHPEVVRALETGMSVEAFMARYLDGVKVKQKMLEEDCGNGAVVDEWGVKKVYSGQMNAIPVDYPVKSPGDLKHYSPPDPLADHRLEYLKAIVNQYGGKKATIFSLNPIFTLAWSMTGMENFLISLRLEPEFADQLLKISFNFNRELIRRAINEDADIILFTDDFAYKTGLLMSLDDFKRFIYPYLFELVREVCDSGKLCIIHSDGKIWEIMDLLIDTGIHGINPLEPLAGMDIERAKREYGRRVCLIGNIDCGDLLSNRSPEEVKLAVRETIRKAAPGGGYMMSSSNAIHASVKPENYKAMIEATEEYGKYPLAV